MKTYFSESSARRLRPEQGENFQEVIIRGSEDLRCLPIENGVSFRGMWEYRNLARRNTLFSVSSRVPAERGAVSEHSSRSDSLRSIAIDSVAEIH